MRFILPSILTLSIIVGQIVKIPLGTHGGVTLLDLTVIGLCLLGIAKLKLHLKKPPLFITAASFFILIALSSLLLTPLHLNLSEKLTSFFYTVRFFFYILFGWLILSGAYVSIKENLHKILLISGAGLAILGLLQFILLPDLQFLTNWGWDPHYLRTVSTFLDPNFAGGFFVLTLMLLMSLRSRTVSGAGVAILKWKIASSLPLLAMTLVYISLLTTFSRSSYLMFLISGLVFAFLRRSKMLASLTIVLFLGLIGGFYLYTQTVSAPRHIDRTQSASSRLSTWQQGLVIVQKFPVLGVGYNSYRYALKELNLADEQFIQTHGASSNDSSLLFVLATTGIVGFVSYLFFLATLMKQGNKLLTAALGGLIIHSFFANSLFYPPILAWLILSTVTPKK